MLLNCLKKLKTNRLFFPAYLTFLLRPLKYDCCMKKGREPVGKRKEPPGDCISAETRKRALFGGPEEPGQGSGRFREAQLQSDSQHVLLGPGAPRSWCNPTCGVRGKHPADPRQTASSLGGFCRAIPRPPLGTVPTHQLSRGRVGKNHKASCSGRGCRLGVLPPGGDSLRMKLHMSPKCVAQARVHGQGCRDVARTPQVPPGLQVRDGDESGALFCVVLILNQQVRVGLKIIHFYLVCSHFHLPSGKQKSRRGIHAVVAEQVSQPAGLPKGRHFLWGPRRPPGVRRLLPRPADAGVRRVSAHAFPLQRFLYGLKEVIYTYYWKPIIL